MGRKKLKNTKHKIRFASLGLNVAYYRKKNNLTQEDLADLAGLSRTHISNIEAPNEPTSLSLSALFDIADALGVKPGALLEER